ncbi:MAG: low specificity L-threonine aldolase, partial [Proteobacteria bacterium]|nr:low specificity L-threonine aldolase [Pseudomonadota bacterium]
NLWLELARTANEKMFALRQGIDSCEAVSVLAGGDGNELFVAMSPEHAEALLALGHLFYAWPSLPQGYRLVTSFTTTDAEIDEFCADLKRL